MGSGHGMPCRPIAIEVLYGCPVAGKLRNGPTSPHLRAAHVYHAPIACGAKILGKIGGIMRRYRIKTDHIIPGHVGSVLLPKLYHFLRMGLLKFLPLLIRQQVVRKKKLLRENDEFNHLSRNEFVATDTLSRGAKV